MPLQGCLVAIVLLIDVSASIPDRLFAMQRDGTASALEDAHVTRTIEATGGLAVMVAEFAVDAATTLHWTVLYDAAGAHRFAEAVRSVPRVVLGGHTSVGYAVEHGRQAFAATPCEPMRRVVDISTDGVESLPRLPTRTARDAAAADGIEINAIIFQTGETPLPGMTQAAMLVASVRWMQEEVATGFVVPVEDEGGYAHALRQKLLNEIAALPGVLIP